MAGPPILREADDRVREWLASVVDDQVIRPGPPTDSDPAAPVNGDTGGASHLTAFLAGIETAPRISPEVHQPATGVFWLRYLVFADTSEPASALRVLDAVLAALLDPAAPRAEGIELAPGPVPDDTWQAMGVRPRPALTLRVSARHTPAREEVAVVRAPLRVIDRPIRALSGRLVGPGDVPIVGAEVSVQTIDARVRTSDAGAFSLPTVPTGPLRLDVRAKGRRFTIEVDPTDEPLLIRCDPSEALP